MKKKQIEQTLSDFLLPTEKIFFKKEILHEQTQFFVIIVFVKIPTGTNKKLLNTSKFSHRLQPNVYLVELMKIEDYKILTDSFIGTPFYSAIFEASQFTKNNIIVSND